VSFAAPIARTDAPLSRRNPLAKLAAGFLFTGALLSTLDPLTPAVAIAAELALVPLFGIGYRTLARRTGPILLSAVGLVVALVLFAGTHAGAVLVRLGPIVITTGTATNALGFALRLLSIALPGVMVFATTDPTDLADALIQNVGAPARFAIGALAAFRLLPLFGQQWRLLGLARRARGIDAAANPLARIRLFASMAFALLVGAIRRGTQLATAMDARGFDSGVPRTVARRQRFGPADWLLILAGAGLGAGCLAVSIAAGTFRALLS
jgi:energy-coupling factor transport system permease protein